MFRRGSQRAVDVSLDEEPRERFRRAACGAVLVLFGCFCYCCGVQNGRSLGHTLSADELRSRQTLLNDAIADLDRALTDGASREEPAFADGAADDDDDDAG